MIGLAAVQASLQVPAKWLDSQLKLIAKVATVGKAADFAEVWQSLLLVPRGQWYCRIGAVS